MTGTGLAQAIPVAVSPILTRLYSPAEFGVFALYISVASIAAVVVTGRYELAIHMPKQDRDALHIVALSTLLSIILSVVLLVLVIIFNRPIATMLGDADLAGWLYWIPASTLLMGGYQSLNYWCNRKGFYKQMSINRALQNGSASVAQLGSGYVGVGAMGLVGGQLSGQALTTSMLAWRIWCDERNLIHNFDIRRMVALAKKYANFPMFLIPGQLANVVSGHMPVLLINFLFGPAIAGFYALSQRVLALPVSLVGSAIGDVFRNEAALAYKKYGNCKEVFLKTVFVLLVFSIIIALPVLLFGPWIFSLVFGEQWREAGEIASIISIMVFFGTISSPLSLVILFRNMHRFDFVWQMLRLFLSVISFYFGYVLFDDYRITIVIYVISFSVLYLMHSSLQYIAACGYKDAR